jgi:hypothetical protein
MIASKRHERDQTPQSNLQLSPKEELKLAELKNNQTTMKSLSLLNLTPLLLLLIEYSMFPE